MPDRPPIRNEWAAWAVDALERTARTFAQGFLAAVSVDALSAAIDGVPDTSLGLGAQLAVGVAAGVWAILTAWVAKPVGAPTSASFLPTHLDPPSLESAPTSELEHELARRSGLIASASVEAGRRPIGRDT